MSRHFVLHNFSQEGAKSSQFNLGYIWVTKNTKTGGGE